jgi:hypothetical protein
MYEFEAWIKRINPKAGWARVRIGLMQLTNKFQIKAGLHE